MRPSEIDNLQYLVQYVLAWFSLRCEDTIVIRLQKPTLRKCNSGRHSYEMDTMKHSF
eukprot:COSAG01_NODE_2236_length_8092_cov_2.596772_2_plen_57_part_00